MKCLVWVAVALAAVAAGLVGVAGAHPGEDSEQAGARPGEVGDPAAVCFERFGFAREPLAVAKVPGSSEVLAEVSWSFGAGGECVLALDDGAVSVLRSAGSTDSLLLWGSASADLSLGEPSQGDREAAEHCYGTTSPFAQEPVDVAWSDDGSAVLAQVKWARSDLIGCYLVLNDNAITVLRAVAQSSASLSLGGSHWCAVRVDRTLACRGSEPFTSGWRPLGGEFTAVAAAENISCAIRVDRTLACWGSESLLDNWDEFDWAEFDPPAGRFTSVSASGDRFGRWCAIRVDGALACWGPEYKRHLRSAQQRPPDGRFTSVSATGGVWGRTCAIRVEGALACWGGVGPDFRLVDPPEGEFTSVATVHDHSCAIRVDRTLACWRHWHPPRWLEGPRAATIEPPEGEFTAISAGHWHWCAISVDRSLECWWGVSEEEPYQDLGQADPPSGQFLSVDAGDLRSCAVSVNLVFECWGLNEHLFFDPLPVQVVYAVPADETPVAGREQFIADVVAEVQTWFRSQTGGRHPLFEMDGDRVSVATVELSDQGDDTLRVQAEVYQSLGSRPPLLMFGEGDFPAAGIDYSWACAHGGWVVLISLGRCTEEYSGDREFGWVVAHELVHLLGAVQPCAPNYSSLGHVLTFFSEDEHPGELSDIMSSWGGSRELSKSVLDVGRDDYYGHGRDDCYDIANNPLLAYPGAELAAAPGVVGKPGETDDEAEVGDGLISGGLDTRRVHFADEGVWCTGQTSSSVSLSWWEVEGAAKTVVSLGDKLSWTVDESTAREAAGTSATVDGLWPGKLHHLFVRFYGAEGDELYRFHTRCRTTNLELLSCPQAHASQASLRLEWDPVPGAAGYVVARTRVPYIRDEYPADTRDPFKSPGGRRVYSEPWRAAFTTGTSLDVGGLAPAVPYLFWLYPLRGVIAENPESALAGRTLEHGWHLEDAVEAIGTVMDTSEIAGLPDGDQPAYIFCWTLPENARCANVGPTTLTYGWDPVPGADGYAVSISDYRDNRYHLRYPTTANSLAFDNLVPGHTYRMQVRPYTGQGYNISLIWDHGMNLNAHCQTERLQ
ncbi:MAG: fibronectin type III domain-containing protein [bacterium]|nr:fibronectin type III domain-containing protein [bacterium]